MTISIRCRLKSCDIHLIYNLSWTLSLKINRQIFWHDRNICSLCTVLPYFQDLTYEFILKHLIEVTSERRVTFSTIIRGGWVRENKASHVAGVGNICGRRGERGSKI